MAGVKLFIFIDPYPPRSGHTHFHSEIGKISLFNKLLKKLIIKNSICTVIKISIFFSKVYIFLHRLELLVVAMEINR